VILTNKNILLISPERWDHIYVSKHHYALHLARKGNRVFFLNPPGSRIGVLKTQFPNVFFIDYRGFPPGLRFYPSFLQKIIIARFFDRLQRLCSVAFDVIWSFDNSVFFDFSALPDSLLKISHIVDLNQDFQTQKAASTADYCFCTTDLIKKRLQLYNSNAYKINHGFHALSQLGNEEPLMIKDRITAVYSGNLSFSYIDWSLLLKVVSDHPDVQFVFIGPNGNVMDDDPGMCEAKGRLLKKENVVFVGKVDFRALQSYYKSADILLVSYQENYHDDQANPHKVMEYLGSGKVIVATHTSEYLGTDPLIVMSHSNSEWPQLFGKVVSNLSFYNSDELQKRRKAFAMQNSYEEQILRIEMIISSRSANAEGPRNIYSIL
jgi:hypothetical protein